MKHPFIVGEKIYLRAFEREDLSQNYFQWANDPEVTHFMETGARPNYLENLEEDYEAMRKSKSDVVFAIVDKQTETVVGTTGLYCINWICRKAEYRILIGEKEFWGKGFGTEAAKLLLTYAFEKLNLERVYLGVNAENTGAVKSYANAGYVEEGRLRKELFRNNRYYDIIRMSILREEYEKIRPKVATPVSKR